MEGKCSLENTSSYKEINHGHIVVTRNLTSRHMRCDNICPRCGEPYESVTHVTFEYSLALQAWVLAATLSHLILSCFQHIY